MFNKTLFLSLKRIKIQSSHSKRIHGFPTKWSRSAEHTVGTTLLEFPAVPSP